MRIKSAILAAAFTATVTSADNWCWDHANTNGAPYTPVTSANGVNFIGTISDLKFDGGAYQPLNIFTPWPNGVASFTVSGYNFVLPLDYKWADQASQALLTAKMQGKQVKVMACFAPYADPMSQPSIVYRSSWVVTAVYLNF